VPQNGVEVAADADETGFGDSTLRDSCSERNWGTAGGGNSAATGLHEEQHTSRVEID